MDLEIRHQLTSQEAQQLVVLYQNEWWSAGRALADVEVMLANSDVVFAYFDKACELVAFARVLTDRVFKAFVFDVIVRKDHRGTGLGARMLEAIKNHPVLTGVRHVELYCKPELVEFYRQFGFSEDTGDVVLMRLDRGVPLR